REGSCSPAPDLLSYYPDNRMIHAAPAVFGQLAALADTIRSRMLLLVEQQPQSTVSRHLKQLAEEGWVTARAEGAARLYRLGELDDAGRRIWDTVRDEIADSATSVQDAQRLKDVLRNRRTRSDAFFAESASQWEAVRAELFGIRAESVPLL